jgi:hypothetical protein
VADDIEAAVVAQVKEIAARGEVRQRILDRFFSDTGALAAAQATRETLNARIAERNVESKRLLAAFSEAGSGGGKTLAARLGEIEAETDRLGIQLGEIEDRLRALNGAREQVEHVASLLDGFDVVWKAFLPEERRELLHLLIDRIVVDFKAGGLSIEFHEFRPPAATPPERPTDTQPGLQEAAT